MVGAATMPPVGRYVSAFRVRSDRITASRHSPSYVQARAPFPPEARRGPQRVPRVDLRRRRLERPVPDQHEREPLAGADQEVGRHRAGGDLDRHVRPQLDRVGAGHRGDRAPPRPEPRDGEAVVEAEPQLRAHRDDAADPLDEPHHAGLAAARRHELGDPDQAVVDRVIRLEDQRVLPVAPARAGRRGRRRQQPAAVLVVAEEGREAGARVEPRQAQPVDRAVPADEARRVRVADERVVLERQGHGARPYPTETVEMPRRLSRARRGTRRGRAPRGTSARRSPRAPRPSCSRCR